MEKTFLTRLEHLFCELMDPAEIRRFVNNLFGRQITSQLPVESTHQLLAHSTVTVLNRNGLINGELFVELVKERPQRHSAIEAVAQEVGIGTLPASGSTASSLTIRTPDYVIRDTYESLRRQREILRGLTHGELHLSRLFAHGVRQDDAALRALPKRVSTWIDAHRHEITLNELQAPLEGLYLLASVAMVNVEAALLGSLATLFFGGEKVQAAVGQLVGFSSLSDQDLYKLALKLVESDR